jgi:hypothetical protein
VSRFELVRTDDGEPISVGDTVTVNDCARVVADLEPPEPEFVGCVHLVPMPHQRSTCSPEAIGAQWLHDGQPVRFEADHDEREAFDSGRWTQADTDSMEAGRDLPMRNEAGEWMP